MFPELNIFINVNVKMEYHEQCLSYVHICKQSFRITELLCKKNQEAK